jgi:hypothetical protein
MSDLVRRGILVAFALTVGFVAFASCSESGGQDEQYLKAICQSSVTFLKQVQGPPDFPPLDPFGMAKQADRYAKTYAAIRPPDDLKEYHKRAIAELNEAVSEFSARPDRNSQATFLSFYKRFPTESLPASVQARLQKAVPNVKECNSAP